MLAKIQTVFFLHSTSRTYAQRARIFGMPTVTLKTKRTNQDGGTLVDATLGVELPY